MAPPRFVEKFRAFDKKMRDIFFILQAFCDKVAFAVETNYEHKPELEVFAEEALTLTTSALQVWAAVPTSNVGTLIVKIGETPNPNPTDGSMPTYTYDSLAAHIQKCNDAAGRLLVTIQSRYAAFLSYVRELEAEDMEIVYLDNALEKMDTSE